MSQPTGYSEGADVVDGASSQVSEPIAPASEVQSSADASPQVADEIKDNPAWKPILDALPTQFHSIAKPVLKEWDSNYGKLAESYAPYKKFSEMYPHVDVDTLSKAFNLWDTLDKNPHELYRRLGEFLKSQEPQQEQEPEPELDPFSERTPEESQEKDPRYEALQQQLLAQQQQLQQFQQQQMTKQYYDQMDAEIRQIADKHGKFDVTDVMNRFLAMMQRGEEPSITKAYQEQQAFIQNVLAQQQAKPKPPQVLSPGGGIPPSADNLSVKTMEDRVAVAKRMLGMANQ